MAHPIAVTDTSFADDVLKSELPVMVDFWAEWCGPCKMIAPIVEDLAEDYSGKMVFAKVDVDSNPETAMKYGVRGIPTLLLFSGGSPVDQVVGAVAKGELVKRIDKVLS